MCTMQPICRYLYHLAKAYRGQTREVENAASDRDSGLGIDVVTIRIYKSALRWCHENSNVLMDKYGHAWPTNANDPIKTAFTSYKRVVGEKKQKEIMQI